MPAYNGAIDTIYSKDHSKLGRQLLTKTRHALNKAIDGLGDAQSDGSTEMAKLITAALREDVVGTLKALQGYMPKEVTVDVTLNTSPLQLTDSQLMEIIESRTKVIEGEIVSDDTAANPHSLVDADTSKCVK